MGERRLVDQDVLLSPDLLRLPATGRLLWIGLVLLASREGLIRGDPEWLRRRILQGLRVQRPPAAVVRTVEAWRRSQCDDSAMSAPPRCSQSAPGCSQAAITQLYVDYMAAMSMLSPCYVSDVKYYRITNFNRYQKFRGRGHHGDGDITETETSLPRPSPPPPEAPEDQIPEEVRRFLDEVLLLPDGNRPAALQKVREIGHTAEDLPAWREALATVHREGKLADPVGFVRSRFVKARTPEAAGFRPANGTGDAPPLSAAERATRDLRRRVRDARERIPAARGAGWDATDDVILTPTGAVPWGAVGGRLLRELAEALGVAEEPEAAGREGRS